MKQYNYLWVFILMLVSSTSWAYGSGSSSKACEKPKFSDFVPAENAEVAAGTSFSFTASKNTYPNTIKVTVKGMPASISVAPKNAGSFQVTGTLPGSLEGAYARIGITAEGQNNCKGAGGWLVKISK